MDHVLNILTGLVIIMGLIGGILSIAWILCFISEKFFDNEDVLLGIIVFGIGYNILN